MRAARTRRGFGRVVVFVVLRYIYIYIYICILKERKKERENKIGRRGDVCLGERDLLYIVVGEKNERNVPPRDKTHEKGGDNRIFFQELGDAAI